MHNNSGRATVWFFQIHIVRAEQCFSSRTDFFSLSGSEQLPSAIWLTSSFGIKSLTSDLRHKFRDFYFIFFLTWPIVSNICFFLKKVPCFLPPQLMRSNRETGMLLVIRNLTPGIHCQFATTVWNCEKAIYWGKLLLKLYVVKFCLPSCSLSIKILCGSTLIFFLFSF